MTAVVGLEAGWIAAEVGRQPWIVYEQMRVSEAVTDISAGPIWASFAAVVVIYALVVWAFLGVLLRMKIRWRHEDAELARADSLAGDRPRPAEPAGAARGRVMTATDLVAVVLLLLVAAYACGGGADFGAGIWDLLAGGKDRGATPSGARRLRDGSRVGGQQRLAGLRPGRDVDRFSSRLRGRDVDDLARRHACRPRTGIARGGLRDPQAHATASPARRRLGLVFGISSTLTPFFLAAVLGGVASGRVPPGNRQGDPVTSWLNPTSVLFGLLGLGVAAFVAASFLVSDARRFGAPELEQYFRRRSALAGGYLLVRDGRRPARGARGRRSPV